MRAWLFAAVLVLGGCLVDIVPSHSGGSGGDVGAGGMAGTGGTGGSGGAGGSAGSGGAAGSGGSGGAVGDGGSDAGGSMGDAGGGTGTLAFGATCTTNTDCKSGLCESINMTMLCTVMCNVPGGTDTTNCPAGTSQQCNQKGFCKP